ncbi:MAG: MFS transporter permease [Geodermatophilaceae bacterium]|nr:MFS transporter permease [Geodermatophilaceae bacterium]
MNRVSEWWTAPQPIARVAAFRVLAYLFIPIDVLLTTAWVQWHGDVSTKLYQPLIVGNLLHLPLPTHTVVVSVQWSLIIAAVLAATGRAPRLLGAIVFVLYFEWMIIAMSYGKVDHDRFAYLVALAVLPTVGVARWRDRGRSEAAGWALRCIQVAVMLTYFFAAWSKVRFGGWDWVTGATLTRAVIRRGTGLAEWTLDVPNLLTTAQWLMLGLELLSPLILLARSDRARIAIVTFLVGFHVMTYAGVTIIFLPHVVAILSMLPWERLHRQVVPAVPITATLDDGLVRGGSP